uniref:Uncharacterized protein n=1 Tax=Caenorhabditis japonica TaxID=281687 RepID=A0A8R1EMR8_CAEJA
MLSSCYDIELLWHRTATLLYNFSTIELLEHRTVRQINFFSIPHPRAISPILSVSIQIVLDGVPASLDSRFHLVKRQSQLGHHINLRLLRTGMLILVP